MKLEIVLICFVFGLFFGRQLPQVIEVEGAVLVDALVDVEVLAVFLFNKNMAAIRADDKKRSSAPLQ